MNSLRASGLLLFAALASLPVSARAAEPPPAKPAVLVGTVTREQIEAADPEWVRAEVSAAPDAAAAQALASVEPGSEVTVFLGVWCGDSRREVPRLWKALDAAGGTVPFEIRYIAVDPLKKEPATDIAAGGIHFVPTLIVSRGGHELGRIVEQSPHGVEKDLLALLTDHAHGVVSASHAE